MKLDIPMMSPSLDGMYLKKYKKELNAYCYDGGFVKLIPELSKVYQEFLYCFL